MDHLDVWHQILNPLLKHNDRIEMHMNYLHVWCPKQGEVQPHDWVHVMDNFRGQVREQSPCIPPGREVCWPLAPQEVSRPESPLGHGPWPPVSKDEVSFHALRVQVIG